MNKYRDKLVWDLEICKNISLLKEAGEIILYGAAAKGRQVLGWLNDAGIAVDCFCDMDGRLWGAYVEGVKVVSPFQLQKIISRESGRVYIIACIQYPKELCVLLEHMELRDICLLTYWGIKTALCINVEAVYGKDSRQTACLRIENSLRKNRFVDVGLIFMQKLVEASDQTIWVVQPGKTASSSLELRLREKGILFIKEHYLRYPSHILGGGYRELWEKSIIKKRKSMKVIAAVREPLSRDYSTFWQAFKAGLERSMLMPILHRDFQKMYGSFVDLILNGSIHTQEKLGISMPYTWNDEFEWFDEQIKEYLAIDVFQYPFDREKGYTLIEKNGVQLFLFKVEKLESILDKIALFAGTTELSAANANVAEQKWYGLAYSQFRREVKLPKKYVDHYYDRNAKVDHFYTQEEKAEFLKRWRENVDGNIG